MGTFYPGGIGNSGGGSGGGGSTGTTNYNNLTNVPIINVTGTDSSPVILSNLSYGHYSLSGYYKKTENSITVTKAPGVFEVYVSEDEIDQNKVVSYYSVKEGKPIIMSLSYNDTTGELEEENNSAENDEWDMF